jgi:uncharacterized protein (DUF983 family)
MMGKLSDSEKERIAQGVRSLVQSHLCLGISTGSRVMCHNCGYGKPLIGAVRYGKYRLCNDCAVRYELAKEEGAVKNIEDFLLDE